MDVTKLLTQVKNNEITIEQAEAELKKLPYEDLGFAKLDHHRKVRQGFEEVVFCQGKTTDHLVKIYQTLSGEGIDVLGTRAIREQYEAVKAVLPGTVWDEVSRVLKVETRKKEMMGQIVVCTGGTADIPVAEEAALTAEFFGSRVDRVFDVGVAGIHRLLARTEEIRKANCVVAVAGMEGALGSVMAGLVENPVIAVPTSVGYGASFGGVSALLTMLNSCAEGMATVNIDNGFGAGYMANQINHLAVGAGKKEA